MVLLPNVPFVDGDIWEAKYANLAFNSPVFDGQTQYLGHRGQIQDAELDPAGTIARVKLMDTSLQVVPTTGLGVQIKPGYCRDYNNTLVLVPLTNLTAPDNATSYVYLDALASPGISVIIPTYSTVLSKVVTSGGTVTSATQFQRPEYARIIPASRQIKVFGGSSIVDKVCTAGEVLPPVVVCRDFIVPSGVTVTIGAYCRVMCQDFKVDGTINGVSAIQGTGGATYAFTGGSGQSGTVDGRGIGGGTTSKASTAYIFLLQQYGSSGAGGGLYYNTGFGNSAGVTSQGGLAGSGLYVEASRNITINGTVNVSGGNATAGTTNNAAGITILGAGGGSGGTIVYICLGAVVFGASAVHNLKGGNGGAAVGALNSTSGCGGGGGGGGQLYVFCANTNPGASAIQITPGTKGADATGGGGALFPGGGGAANGGVGGFTVSGGTYTAATSGSFTINTEVPIGL